MAAAYDNLDPGTKLRMVEFQIPCAALTLLLQRRNSIIAGLAMRTTLISFKALTGISWLPFSHNHFPCQI
eukprot:6574812-Ditylum_brightwellii.AAC.1